MTKTPSWRAARRSGAAFGKRPPIQTGMPPGRAGVGRNCTPRAVACGPSWCTGSPDSRPRSTARPSSSSRGPHPRVDLLAEAGQLTHPAVVAEPEAEHQPTAGEPVERDRLAGQHLRSAARQGRHHRADLQPLRGEGDRGQADPGVGDRAHRLGVEQVVPDEEAVPARCLGVAGQVGEHGGLGEHVERRDEQAAAGGAGRRHGRQSVPGRRRAAAGLSPRRAGPRRRAPRRLRAPGPGAAARAGTAGPAAR